MVRLVLPAPDFGWIWNTLPRSDCWIGTPCPCNGWILNTLPGTGLNHPTPWRWLDWYTPPLAMVGFETPYPVAIVGFVHPVPWRWLDLAHPTHSDGWTGQCGHPAPCLRLDWAPCLQLMVGLVHPAPEFSDAATYRCWAFRKRNFSVQWINVSISHWCINRR